MENLNISENKCLKPVEIKNNYNELINKDSVMKLKNDIDRNSEYINSLDMNLAYIKYSDIKYNYESQITLYGIAVKVSDINKGDVINLYGIPTIVRGVLSSKKTSIWILGKSLLDLKDSDVVFEKHELIEKLKYDLFKANIIELKGSKSLCNIHNFKRNENITDDKNYKLVKKSNNISDVDRLEIKDNGDCRGLIDLPASNKEIYLYDQILYNIKNNIIFYIEIISVMGYLRITRILE